MTLKNEEPDVTIVSIRPGVVDSEMQREVREVYHDKMDAGDRAKFIKAKAEGTLLRPEQPGNVIARLAIGAGRELSGKFLRCVRMTSEEMGSLLINFAVGTTKH